MAGAGSMGGWVRGEGGGGGGVVEFEIEEEEKVRKSSMNAKRSGSPKDGGGGVGGGGGEGGVAAGVQGTVSEPKNNGDPEMSSADGIRSGSAHTERAIKSREKETGSNNKDRSSKPLEDNAPHSSSAPPPAHTTDMHIQHATHSAHELARELAAEDSRSSASSASSSRMEKKPNNEGKKNTSSAAPTSTPVTLKKKKRRRKRKTSRSTVT